MSDKKKPEKDNSKDKPEKNAPTSTNRQAHHFYTLDERFNAGIELRGTEVKALRQGKANLQDGFARFEKGELFLFNVHISPYEQGNIFNHDPVRPRKLLLHKVELKRIFGLLTKKGLTVIPLKIYFRGGIAKCEIAIAQAKKAHDRRRDIKERIVDREIRQVFRKRN